MDSETLIAPSQYWHLTVVIMVGRPASFGQISADRGAFACSYSQCAPPAPARAWTCAAAGRST